MLFVDWQMLWTRIELGVCLCGGLLALWTARQQRLWFRIVTCLVVIPSLLWATILLVFVCALASGTSSAPVYSPDHQSVARVTFYGGPGNADRNGVDLYETHGIRVTRVFDGNMDAVLEGDLA